MSKIADPSSVNLYVWPGQWGLPSTDAQCLAAIALLQSTIPGQFNLVRCTNPDQSPSGQLPYLTHDGDSVLPLTSIVKYVVGLNQRDPKRYQVVDIDDNLSPTQNAQKNAYRAHVLSDLGDVVNQTMYANEHNWAGLTHKAYVSLLPIPQRYYVPWRLRESIRPRLQAAGLWSFHEEKGKNEMQKDKVKKESTKAEFRRAFEREKVLEKARAVFHIYDRLLGENECFYPKGGITRFTTLDLFFTAHIALLLYPTYPDPLLQNLLTESYPKLVKHARSVFELSLSSSVLPPLTVPDATGSLWIFAPWNFASQSKVSRVKTQEERTFDKLRWGFFGLAIGSIAAYIAVVGSPIVIRIVEQDSEVDSEDELEGVVDTLTPQ